MSTNCFFAAALHPTAHVSQKALLSGTLACKSDVEAGICQTSAEQGVQDRLPEAATPASSWPWCCSCHCTLLDAILVPEKHPEQLDIQLCIRTLVMLTLRGHGADALRQAER
eukprot:GHUV01027415.1.p1 GENE.GHUV01027415.1~~GHUV01027415.1.p1  ORF type:complete len:112 (+),score=3.38 GHUV01027415.1:960-1295(+)